MSHKVAATGALSKPSTRPGGAACATPDVMDHSPINQNFELNKSRQKFHHSLKEHHKISNIPKFRCKMLQNAYNIALRSLQFSVILDYKREMVTTSVRNTK